MIKVIIGSIKGAHLYSLWSNKQLNGLIVLLRDGGQRPLVNISDMKVSVFVNFWSIIVK